MLDKIIKSIEEEASKEIEKIQTETREKEQKLEKEFEKKMKERLEQEKALLLSSTKKEIEEFLQKESSQSDFRLQEEKKRIITSVYDKAKENVASLDDKDYKKLMTKLLTPLKGLKGDISADKKTALFLKKFDMKVKDDLKEQGIFFTSEEMEMDLTIERLLLSQKEVTDPKVIDILFYA